MSAPMLNCLVVSHFKSGFDGLPIATPGVITSLKTYTPSPFNNPRYAKFGI